MNEETPTCQDLKKAIDDFVKAIDNLAERRRIVREVILLILPLILPGWQLIDPDTATEAELEAWVNNLLNGQHACASVFQASGGN